MKDSVFLSYPKPYLEKQKQFIEKVVSYLENRGLQPRTLGVTDYDMDAPLTAIRRLLLESNGLKPRGNLAVPPFYCYRACDVKRIQEALNNGCGYDAPGSFAAWLSKQTPMHAYVMPGKRYDIGDINSYEYVKSVFLR